MTTILSVWNLYRPRAYSSWFIGTLLAMLTLIGVLLVALRVSVSLVALAALITWLPYISLKFRADSAAFGYVWAVFAVLVPAQLLHLVEHSAQMVQIHLLAVPPALAGGIISQLNSEIVHFLWNIGIVTVSLWLYAYGARGVLMLINIGWAMLHTGEHVYMMSNYILSGGIQGLPGILGRNGWLSQAPITQDTFLCRLPIATTWIRPDIHFSWNVVEVILLLLAFGAFIRANTSVKRDQTRV